MATRKVKKVNVLLSLGTLFLILFSCQGNKNLEGHALASGEELYVSYCMICHGEAGNGSMAELLTVEPPDLTKIAARRGGEFPEEEIFQIIDGRQTLKGHGTRDMPIWGLTFKNSEKLKNEKQVEKNIQKIVDYLKTIQTEG